MSSYVSFLEIKVAFWYSNSRFFSRKRFHPFRARDVNETLCYANYVAKERNLIFFFFHFILLFRVLCSSVQLLVPLFTSKHNQNTRKLFISKKKNNEVNTWNSFPKDKFNFLCIQQKSWRKKSIFYLFPLLFTLFSFGVSIR